MVSTNLSVLVEFDLVLGGMTATDLGRNNATGSPLPPDVHFDGLPHTGLCTGAGQYPINHAPVSSAQARVARYELARWFE